ncbi:MAG: hypothetical protein PUP92_35540 [Rhizonema sp. PD38]|nr:hypothetical protein [Rhizonema sp. PD38]
MQVNVAADNHRYLVQWKLKELEYKEIHTWLVEPTADLIPPTFGMLGAVCTCFLKIGLRTDENNREKIRFPLVFKLLLSALQGKADHWSKARGFSSAYPQLHIYVYLSSPIYNELSPNSTRFNN